MILFGEGHVHFHVVSSLLSDELFLKGIDEGVGTDGQRVILALAAFKRFAVRKAFIIDHSHIAVFYRSVHRNHSGVVLSLLVQVCVNLFVGNRHVGLRHFHTLIGAKRNFRLQSHFCRKDEGLSGLDLLCDGQAPVRGEIPGAALAAEDAAPLPQSAVPVGTGEACVQGNPVELFAEGVPEVVVQAVVGPSVPVYGLFCRRLCQAFH